MSTSTYNAELHSWSKLYVVLGKSPKEMSSGSTTKPTLTNYLVELCEILLPGLSSSIPFYKD